jgi:omega-amidase
MREIAIAIVQMAPKLAKVEENLSTMVKLVDKICTEQKKVDLIVFPELATTGYELGPAFTDVAERLPGQSVHLLAQRAIDYSTHILFGLVSKEKVESIIYNSAVLIGSEGEVLGVYHKVHLPGEERIAFRAGYRLPVFETDFGQVGVLLGWDLAFPEAARSLALDGAELLCVCASWTQSPDQDQEVAVDEWRTYVHARALENSLYVAASNRIGEEYTYRFFGDSRIVGPRGETYVYIEEEESAYAVATIDLDAIRKTREELQHIQCRQPQAYRNLVRKY